MTGDQGRTSGGGAGGFLPGEESRKTPWPTLFVIFAVFFLVYIVSPVGESADSVWTIPTALSILRQGNTDVDEYPELLAYVQYHGIEQVKGHYYSIYPIAEPFLAVPAVLGADWALRLFVARFPGATARIVQAVKTKREQEGKLQTELPKLDVMLVRVRIEMLIASVIVALTALFIYLIARFALERSDSGRAPGDPRLNAHRWALFITFAFAFGTAAWSTASRGLWQHGPSMLMLSIALYVLLRADERPARAQFAAIPLVLAYACRPTNSISLALLAACVLLNYRRYFLPFIGWALVAAAPFVVYNLSVYRSVLQPYFLPGYQGHGSRFYEALAGNLISPARGLFVFSPFLLAAIWGVVGKFRQRAWQRLDSLLLGAIFLHWIIISYSSKYWWAGHSYGPRLFSDMLPYFAFFLIPAALWWRRSRRRPRVIAAVAFGLALAISLAINFRGATSMATRMWNPEPVNVDQNPARVWDWHDLQFLR